MNLKIPKILTAKELVDKSFHNASLIEKKVDPGNRIDSIRGNELKKIDAVYQMINDHLKKVHDSFPSIDNMNPAYSALIGIVVSKGDMKKSLAALHWAIDFNRELVTKSKRKLSGSGFRQMNAIRKEFYGRIMSVLKQIDKNLKFLDEARHAFRKLPQLQDLPTVVIAGFPNVGKSSLLKALTGAEPEIQPYPFTTKGILLGCIENLVQLVDTPGLLDRSLEKRNNIEMQAIVALKHIANKILFVLDPTEICGYTIDKQVSLLNNIKDEFDKPVIIVANKEDAFDNSKSLGTKLDFSVSCINGTGIQELKEHILKTTRLTLAKSFRK